MALFRRHFLIHTGVSALSMGALSSAVHVSNSSVTSDSWPRQAVRLMVGAPAGSSPDTTARILAEALNRAWGQPVVVVNKTGASGNIAADMVAKAKDEHTLGLMINGNMTTAKLLNPLLNFDPQQDLLPVSLISVAPLVLVVNTPINPKEFFQIAREQGRHWSYGSPGIGTHSHIGMEMLKAHAGNSMEAIHMPYDSNLEVITALLERKTQLALLPPGLALPHLRSERLYAIGVTSTKKSTLIPNVPSLGDLGINNFNLEIWNAVAVPKSFPPNVLETIAHQIAQITRTSDVQEKLFAQGWHAIGSSPQELATRIRRETQSMEQIIKTEGTREKLKNSLCTAVWAQQTLPCKY